MRFTGGPKAGAKSTVAKSRAAKVAKSVGTGKAKRDAALAQKRGIATSGKADTAKVDAEVRRSKNQV